MITNIIKLGVIGYGNRLQGIVQELKKQDERCQVKAVVDFNQDKVRKVMGTAAEGCLFFDSPEEMLQGIELDGILIGTNCSSHTETALKVISSGIPVFLEKPVSTTMEDLRRLKKGSEIASSDVLVSFPLRVSPLVGLVKEILDSGKIGTVEHVQAFNNVSYGGVYYHSWFRNEKETGGLFLQKATHDFDYLQHLLQLKPIQVCAMTSKQVFKGSKPALLKCVDCSDNKVCHESTLNDPESEWMEYCCFAEDTGNEDSGSAIVQYESGMHLAYTQNFIVRRTAGNRGARFVGYKGTVDFDFYQNEVKVTLHHSPRVGTYKYNEEDNHFGGDKALALNFIGMIQGKERAYCTLEDGMLSALICLKAKESSQSRMFCEINW